MHFLKSRFREVFRVFSSLALLPAYGIIIRMYCAPSEHNPPHFHAYYGEFKATIDIGNCELIERSIPKKTIETSTCLIRARQEELRADWILAMNSELPFKIEPLR